MKKIFITGGHYTPAKAVIDELQKRGDFAIFYLGRKYATEDSQALALEYESLKDYKGVKYLVLTTGRLQRKFFVNVKQSLKAFLKIFIGFPLAAWYLIRYRPNIVLSFGGYVALPVAVNAWLLGIPVVTHEQTKIIGLANRIIRLLGAKVLAIGLPLRWEILEARVRPTNLLFITGGSQGSKTLYEAVKKILPRLGRYKVLFQNKHFLEAGKMAASLARARLVISRSGANTVAEIAWLGRPAIFVPLPWAGGDEQAKNAQVLANLGMAEIIRQDNLSKDSLLAAISKIEKNYPRYLASGKKGKQLVDPKAAQKIVDELEKNV